MKQPLEDKQVLTTISFSEYKIQNKVKMFQVPNKLCLMPFKKVVKLTIKDPRSGRSVGFFLRHRSTKSLMLSEKILVGNFGGGWLTMYSNSSNMAIGFIPGDLGVRGVRG